MDVLAVKEACKFAKEYALQNGPIVSNMLLNPALIHLEVCHVFRNQIHEFYVISPHNL